MIIIFDKKIYNKSSINNAISFWKQYANFKIISDDKKIELKIDIINDKYKNDFENEFCNHVLFYCINSKR